MKKALIRTTAFEQAWQRLTPCLQTLVNRKIYLLAENPAYPSLQAHRLRQTTGLWECYVSTTLRLVYRRTNSHIYLVDVGTHRMLDRVYPRQHKTTRQIVWLTKLPF